MSFFDPNARQRYYPPSSSPSTTNLIQQPPELPSRRVPNHLFTKKPLPPFSGSSNTPSSISEKFSLSPDPKAWGSNLSPNFQEPDDYLHNPDPQRDRRNDRGSHIFTYRGLTNLGCLILICVALLSLFAGYPLISHFLAHKPSNLGGFNIGGINASGQIASLPGHRGTIDVETPHDAYTMKSYYTGQEMQLVFSDEFNVDGRTFYPGDDPYWEAVDLHYWATNNLEWYDPAAITTRNGALEITLSELQTHGLNYQGGMLSSWNKFCFTGGILQAAVVLPGANNVLGFWPSVWSLGNLGRAGYGASLEGVWPYSYDACDVGTAPNQTLNGLPLAATENGDPFENNVLSFLPGQKLSRCTCKGQSHPGPVHSDGTYVGRAAPEIDVFEAQIDAKTLMGYVSQSAQWGPFNEAYEWFNTSDNLIIVNPAISTSNLYVGAAYQQSTSVLTKTDQNCYELLAGCFAVYAFEYAPGFDNAYISWISNGTLAWTMTAGGLAADSRVEISARPISQEPMYIIMNLGMSRNFGPVDLEHLTFPATMRVDYIRVYQPANAMNIGCDPEGFPTQAYINQYIEAYTNPNLTTWGTDFRQPFPSNRFLGQC